jgi:ppGpp synthetase/RelA/SpoT-type nucleotidyltranferase
MTNTQIRKLGDRLRLNKPKEEDLRLLDAYRQSFAPAYEDVIRILTNQLRLPVTGRRSKTTPSIIAKLQREKTRLDGMQDIAGCRVVVQDAVAQYHALDAITAAFPAGKLVDRTARPSHGYRAFHVIVEHQAKMVEIQVRTELQHWWAELSEKLSDALGLAVKYGGGPEDVRTVLQAWSESIWLLESHERSMAGLVPGSSGERPDDQELVAARKALEAKRRGMIEVLQRAVATLQAGRK